MKKRRIGNNKKAEGALSLSFGMIFSIILMILFIMVAFMAIKYFLNVRDCAKVGIFLDNFQNEVDRTWNGQAGSFVFNGMLPAKVKQVCFANLTKKSKGKYEEIGKEISIYKGSGANLFFYPRENSCKISYKTIAHLDIESIIKNSNPYCIPLENGNFKAYVKKEFNQRLVAISKEE